MFSKVRLDALSDGIFAVAMTLLILDVRLPDDFHPEDGRELLRGFADLWPKLLPYVLSFGVLGLRWLSTVEIRTRAEHVGREYVNWWLLYLFLIALVGMRLIAITPDRETGDHLRRRQMSAILLSTSSLLAIVFSFVDSPMALWTLALSFAGPLLRRWNFQALARD